MKKRLLALVMSLLLLVVVTAFDNKAKESEQAKEETKKEEVKKEESSNTQNNKEESKETSKDSEKKESEEKKESKEEVTIKWNAGTSGNVLLTIAEAKGFLKDEGINIEYVPATANADAMTMLATGKVDVVSNSGTSNPLQQISSGVDLTIFGGHMLTGAMPIIAKKDTEWKGVESLIGKKFACNPAYFALTGAVMDLGYEKPLEALEWVSYTTYPDALAAVIKGEVDFALQGTGQNFAVKNMDEVKIVAYQSDIMPNYSCCRVEARTEFFNENKDALKRVLKALIRAQEYYEGHKDEAAELQAAYMETEVEYVNAYMQDPHYRVHIDPLRKSVVRAWNILDKTGFLNEKAKSIDINDHVNTDLYLEALEEVIAEHYNENPAFYDGLKQFHSENN